MIDEFFIESHKGQYSVRFDNNGIDNLDSYAKNNVIFIVDKNISRLYKSRLDKLLNSGRVIEIEAIEENKSLDQFPKYIHSLVKLNVKRGCTLVGVGGGIIQDITCFLAATMMRGLPWIFYPTTLLAQADSCIGSKSSINSGNIKNIIGTFTPPCEVIIDVEFLDTLEQKDITSGIGEMLKVHAIDSPESFDKISADYKSIISNINVMKEYIYSSLLIKKYIIEVDEFDQNIRNVMNYGHSFGHAIESATDYLIPHGIAVTIGMDIANYVAFRTGVSDKIIFNRMHNVLSENYKQFANIKIDVIKLLSALSNDKKNTEDKLKLILPDSDGNIKISLQTNNKNFENIINNYMALYNVGTQ